VNSSASDKPNPKLDSSWAQPLAPVFASAAIQDLRAFLKSEVTAGKRIYPPLSESLNALNATPLSAVKLVILGQDPYPGAGQAHGLSFSVKPGFAVPRSLVNIYQELARDVAFVPVKHGYLQAWAARGVLLLNAVLSVEAGQPDSHKGRGWEVLTDAVVDLINTEREHVVFLLWGRNAKLKGARIDRSRHLVLEAAHPSPLSAHNGFFGCQHFSKANAYLQEHGIGAIDWQLPLQV
jgi:uracil-DNA glycosylase